ncbi:hypothetical protein GCM10009557_14510 [Virgisporangium ochraceum]
MTSDATARFLVTASVSWAALRQWIGSLAARAISRNECGPRRRHSLNALMANVSSAGSSRRPRLTAVRSSRSIPARSTPVAPANRVAVLGPVERRSGMSKRATAATTAVT